jgi:hypothetical protein
MQYIPAIKMCCVVSKMQRLKKMIQRYKIDSNDSKHTHVYKIVKNALTNIFSTMININHCSD